MDGAKISGIGFLGKISIFASFLLFAILSVFLYSPVLDSHADDSSLMANDYNTYVSVTTNADNLEFSATPMTSGNFESKPIIVTADTNSNAGYELFFSSEDNANDMKNDNESVDSVIASDFDGEIVGSLMPINRWGYSLDNKSFLKIPIFEEKIKVVDIDHMPYESEKTIPIYIGMRVSSNLPAGKYSKSVVFTVIAHDPFIDFPDTISTMQEMTPEIVKMVSNGAETTLLDVRDGNRYSVKKMMDGNIWMTKNLGIEGKTLTPQDSDVYANYVLPASEIFDESDGDFYEMPELYVDPETNVGYYNQNAATAGSYIYPHSSSAETEASSSICPKGWRLPRGKTSDSEYKKLIDMYGDARVFNEEFKTEYSGSVYSRAIKNLGESVALRNSTINGLSAKQNNVYTSSLNSARGFSVRCIARTDDKVEIMQNYSDSSLGYGESVVLEDARDHNRYNVKKLLDGKVWMTENLRLADKYVSSAFTDLGRQPEVITFGIPESNINMFRSNYHGPSAYVDKMNGGYYNYYTAIAGSLSSDTKNGEAPESICPKGWRLPTSAEYNNLFLKYASSPLLQQEAGFGLSGYVHEKTINQQGLSGGFWSSTIYDKDNAYVLRLNITSVEPASADDKWLGASIRCVVRESEEAVGTMQSFDKNSLVNIGDSALLEDERDGSSYLVRKLKDGKVWMVENLRIQGKTITSDDSDLPDGEIFSIPSSDLKSFTNVKSVNGIYTNNSVYVGRDGGYYSFYTVTAGWNAVENENSPKSICPKGWKLPDGKEGGDMRTLLEIVGTYWRSLAREAGFIRSGDISRGHIYKYQNMNYWTSTVNDSWADQAYEFTDAFSDEDDLIQESSSTDEGKAVHCVAR